MYKAVWNIGYHTIEFRMNQIYYSTGNNNNVIIKRYRLKTSKQCVKYASCRELDPLPNDIKTPPRISILKSNLSQHLLNEIEMLLM